MGLLDNILGGGRSQTGGGPSTITLALMALLAYRTYQGKGRLAGMLGRTSNDNARGDEVQRPGSAGGLGGVLGGLLGRPGTGPGTGGSAAGGLADSLRGGLGGLLGGAAGTGAAGGFLGAGLDELIRKIQQNGHADAANSWVGTGENRRLNPDQLELALGRDTLKELSAETGKPYDEVLSELSDDLPRTVDKLTPEGRLPTSEEQGRWL